MSATVVALRDGDVTHDDAIRELLLEVYVGGGFVPASSAPAFDAARVRARGTVLVARDGGEGAVMGMAILVAPGAPHRQASTGAEAELHLLAVDPRRRRTGAGSKLIAAVEAEARARGYASLVLSTQPTMADAHRLYVAAAFERDPARDWTAPDGSARLVYAKRLAG